jgi:hypothetical protein
MYISETFNSVDRQRKRRWVLRGIVSSSLVLGGDCDLSNFIVFSDVSKLNHWLRTVIPENYNEEVATSGVYPDNKTALTNPVKSPKTQTVPTRTVTPTPTVFELRSTKVNKVTVSEPSLPIRFNPVTTTPTSFSTVAPTRHILCEICKEVHNFFHRIISGT